MNVSGMEFCGFFEESEARMSVNHIWSQSKVIY